MDMQEVKFEVVGTRPLLMHNPRVASPLDPYAQQLKELTGKRKKSLEDYREIARVEHAAGLYINDDGPYVPESWLMAAVAKNAFATAKISKAAIMADVIFSEPEVRLEYEGPRTVDELWGDGPGSPHVDLRQVKTGQARVDRCRPVFHEWGFKTSALVNIENINVSTFRQVLDATAYRGLGDFRPLFGTFQVEYL